MKMHRGNNIFRPFCVLSCILVACLIRCGNVTVPRAYQEVEQFPQIEPDYSDVVIPPNIAPLNFMVRESGLQHIVRIHSMHGKPITILADNTRVLIPIQQWKRLLKENLGQKIVIDIYVQQEKGRWNHFKPLSVTVAHEKIDPFLAYRLIEPQYEYYRKMGIYQRNLENFHETCFLHNRVTGANCMNCHTFHKNQTDRMIFHMRAGPASGTMLIENGTTKKINTATDFNKAGAYASWHPNGNQIVFSVNKLKGFFHAKGENRDVLDMRSDLVIYDIQSNMITTCPMISDPERLETFPCWSADGQYLYFCSAPKFESFFKADGDLDYDQIKYDLMRIAYDPKAERFGKLETVLSSHETHLSITMPRISPDGRYVLFCMAQYGNFPIYRPDCDLYVMDLKTGRYNKPDINSDHASETYHSWSSNSRWIVFSSKRNNGLCARPYISYVSKDGKFHKPFLMPQKDPSFYETYFMTYNVPELISEPIRTRWQEITRVAFDNQGVFNAKLDPRIRVDRSTGATPEEEAWKKKPPK